MNKVFIAWAKRTPIGSFGGVFKDLSAVDLGAKILLNFCADYPKLKNRVSDLICGNVLSAGLGQAPAKQLVIKAGLDLQTQALLVNKVCSSSLAAIHLGFYFIATGRSDLVLAGGVESMSNAPHLLSGLRFGLKVGSTQLIDHLQYDGLTNAFDGALMGSCCEEGAKIYSIGRDEQDEYAILSYRRAIDATQNGQFKNEIVPVSFNERIIDTDEEPTKFDQEKLKKLKPAFKKDGTITAGNASSLSDGACFVLLCSEKALQAYDLNPLAEVIGLGWSAAEPEKFFVAPVEAIKNACTNCGIKPINLNVFEVNEAFSLVPLLVQKALNLPLDILNVKGGAVSLGHPIGVSGARIVTTLIYIMHEFNLARGVAAICNGGGEALSVILKLCK